MKICSCPAAESLPSITKVTCGENFGQIQRIAFQRIQGTAGKNEFKTDTIKTKESWEEGPLTAMDASKIVLSPFVEAPAQEGGDAITFGGGNDTLGGMERIIGSNPTTMTFVIRECPQKVIAELKQMMCEKNLGVYLFNESGQIEAIESAPQTHQPIPIYNLFIGDKIHGGFDTPDSNAVSFTLPANYSDKLVIVTPTDFNPLTDLDA